MDQGTFEPEQCQDFQDIAAFNLLFTTCSKDMDQPEI